MVDTHKGHILAKVQLRSVRDVLLRNFRIFEFAGNTGFCENTHGETQMTMINFLSVTTPAPGLSHGKSFVPVISVPLIENSTCVKSTPLALVQLGLIQGRKCHQ